MKHFAVRGLVGALIGLSVACIGQGMLGMFESHTRVKKDLRLYEAAYDIYSKYSIESEISEADESKLHRIRNAISFRKEDSSSIAFINFRRSFDRSIAAVIGGLIAMFALWGYDDYRMRHERNGKPRD